MVYRVAVNGFGRIGRNYVRAALERGLLGDGGIELHNLGAFVHFLDCSRVVRFCLQVYF